MMKVQFVARMERIRERRSRIALMLHAGYRTASCRDPGGANMAGTKSAGYKLASYQSADGPRAGLVVDDKVFDAAKVTGKAAYASVIGILEDWKTAAGLLSAAAAK